MKKPVFDSIYLLVLKMLGMTTSEEEKKLEKLVREHKKLSSLLQSLDRPEEYRERAEFLNGIDTERELAVFLKNHQKSVFRWKRFYRNAAAVLLLLGSGVSVYWFGRQPEMAPEESCIAAILPANQGAVLTLSDGSSQALDEQNLPIMETDGSFIVKDSTRLNYTGIASRNKGKSIYNRLSVGRGFEYMLILQDGTKVWINSESDLEYPVQFVETTRRVKLSGEAYFEVARDTARPFIVEVNGQFDVRVLGTRFNIKAYPGEDCAETTLAEGKVAIGDVVLKPSEQAVIYPDKAPEIRQVNVSYYLAWHEGWFYFDNERLEQALKQLGRWYNVQFIFQEEEIRHLMVTGKLKRFENLRVILDMLSTTAGCRFQMEEQRVYVTGKDNRK